MDVSVIDSSSLKVVTFGGKMYECLKQFDDGLTEPLEMVITQLGEEDLDYRKLNKLITEVIIIHLQAIYFLTVAYKSDVWRTYHQVVFKL